MPPTPVPTARVEGYLESHGSIQAPSRSRSGRLTADPRSRRGDHVVAGRDGDSRGGMRLDLPQPVTRGGSRPLARLCGRSSEGANRPRSRGERNHGSDRIPGRRQMFGRISLLEELAIGRDDDPPGPGITGKPAAAHRPRWNLCGDRRGAPDREPLFLARPTRSLDRRSRSPRFRLKDQPRIRSAAPGECLSTQPVPICYKRSVTVRFGSSLGAEAPAVPQAANSLSARGYVGPAPFPMVT